MFEDLNTFSNPLISFLIKGKSVYLFLDAVVNINKQHDPYDTKIDGFYAVFKIILLSLGRLFTNFKCDIGTFIMILMDPLQKWRKDTEILFFFVFITLSPDLRI